jgi:propanol-preferring alcohol dehydrogenase
VSGGGLGLDGGMAEYMLVPSARFLVPLGAVDPIKAAPLADAALTPYHAISKSRDRLHPGSTAVVIGAGGLGQMGIQLLKVTTGARVIAVDTDVRKLEIARSVGADIVIPSDPSAAGAIRAATSGVGADAVFDMVGADATLALAAKALRAEGRLVIIGLAMGTLPVNFFALPYGAEVATSYWGTLPELIELVALARNGKLRLEVDVFPLERAAEAYERLRRGEIRGRAVITPAR